MKEICASGSACGPCPLKRLPDNYRRLAESVVFELLTEEPPLQFENAHYTPAYGYARYSAPQLAQMGSPDRVIVTDCMIDACKQIAASDCDNQQNNNVRN